MANPASGKKTKKAAQPQVITDVFKTEAALTPMVVKNTAVKAAGRAAISLAEARKGIILSEILGEPLSKRRRYVRWR